MAGHSRLFGIVLPAGPLRKFFVRLAAEPEFALRNIHLALHLNIVAMDRNTDTGRLGRKLNPPFMHVVGKGAVKIIRQQITDRAAVVPEKALGFIYAPDQADP